MSTQPAITKPKPGALQGLYLVEPHGRLIAERRKTLIAKSKHLPLEGNWLLLSKDNGRGLEYGEITVGQPRVVSIEKFDSLFKYHRVTPKERCYDGDTRAYTDEGLKHFHELKPGMKVLSLSDKMPHIAKWNAIKRVFIYDYEGPMIHFDCPRSADLLVTPHHRLFFLHKGYAPAYDRLNHWEYCLPVSSAFCSGRRPRKWLRREGWDKKYLSRPMMRLLGWYLAEGSYRTEWTQVRFSLNGSDEEEVQEVRGLLDTLGFKHSSWYSKRAKGMNISCYDKRLLQIVKEFGRTSHVKRIPQWVFSLHHFLMWEIFLGHQKGDGDKKHCLKGYMEGTRRSLSSVTVSSELQLGLVELGIRLGFRVNIDFPRNRLYFSECRRTVIRECDTHLVQYKGITWDVEVNNDSNLLVERNGKFSFSGNSKWWPTKIELYLYPITNLDSHSEPKPVEIPAGTQTIVEKIKYLSTLSESKPSEPKEPKEPSTDVEPGQDRERPYSEVGAPRAGDTHSDPAEKGFEHERKEVTMPYTSMENANPAIRGIKPPVTLAQANVIAGWADKTEAGDDGARSPWAVAIAQFKKLYRVQAGKWVKKEKASTVKEMEIEGDFITLQELLKGFGLDEIAVKAVMKARGEGQGVGGPKQGDAGAELCVCPRCGYETKHERSTPCAEVECPECGTTMQGKSTKGAKEIANPIIYGCEPAEGWTTLDAEEIGPEPDKKEAKPNNMIYEPGGKGVNAQSATKGGRRLQSSKLEFLGSLKGKLESLLKELGELIGWASYDDQKPIMFQESSGFKALKAQDGRTHLLTWTMNAFKDREHEIFTLKSIEDYVARNAEKATKGTFDFWHVPGSDFGTITWQGVVGRFLVESGPFNDTPIGRQAEKFFLAHTKGHPKIAPEGWGTSHRYYYKEADKQNGVYTWFDKRKTTVLPRSAAANIFNPELEVTTMDQKQKDGLVEIWGEETAAQIIKLGESETKELEQDGVATKSQDNTESGESQEGESQETKGASEATKTETETKPTDAKPEQEVKEIITNVADELQLGALSNAFKALGDAVGKLGENVQGINTRLDALEVTDEKKLAEKEQALPRYSWFVASQAAETVLGETDALKSARPQVPEAISRLSGSE